MSAIGEVVVGLVILVGLAGILVQVLPGSSLVLVAIAVWSILTGGVAAWVVLGVSAVAIIGTTVLNYVLAGRRLRRAGVPNATLLWGGLAGIVGFFVIPGFGLVIGFILGVYVAEYLRRRDRAVAWGTTKVALRTAGLMILIDLAGALTAVAAWIVGLIVT